jgi:hypothetical protein
MMKTRKPVSNTQTVSIPILILVMSSIVGTADVSCARLKVVPKAANTTVQIPITSKRRHNRLCLFILFSLGKFVFDVGSLLKLRRQPQSQYQRNIKKHFVEYLYKKIKWKQMSNQKGCLIDRIDKSQSAAGIY